MKIGIDVRVLMDERYSGVSEFAYNLIKEILKLDKKNEYRLFYNSFKDLRGFEQAMADLRGQEKERVSLIKYKYPNKLLNYFLFNTLSWPKIDSRLEADIFWMPHINFIALSGRAKSILTIHDLSFMRYGEFFSARKNFWHKMINAKKLVKKFDKIIAVSENTKSDIIELCGVRPEKIEVIYPGLGEEFKEVISNKLEVRSKYSLPEKFILFLGTIEPRKNIEGLISAFNELKKDERFKEYKLVLAGGKGWKSENIYLAWKSSPYKDDINFLGYIPKEEKPFLYSLASLFVYPSFYEGFGFPPLEAMASGVPVIISFASSLPEVIGGAGLMVDPYNITDIKIAMEKVLMDEKFRNSLVEKGFEQVKKFTWQKTAEKYLQIFRDL